MSSHIYVSDDQIVSEVTPVDATFYIEHALVSSERHLFEMTVTLRTRGPFTAHGLALGEPMLLIPKSRFAFDRDIVYNRPIVAANASDTNTGASMPDTTTDTLGAPLSDLTHDALNVDSVRIAKHLNSVDTGDFALDDITTCLNVISTNSDADDRDTELVLMAASSVVDFMQDMGVVFATDDDGLVHLDVR